MGNTTRRSARLAAEVAVATLAFAGCGGGDDGEQAAQGGGGQTAAQAQAGDAQRYCRLAMTLERNAEQHFGQLGEGTTPTEFRKAHAEFIEVNQDVIGQIASAAPAEIRDEVETTLAGMRQQAGEQVDVTAQDIDAADQALRAFEKRECGSR